MLVVLNMNVSPIGQHLQCLAERTWSTFDSVRHTSRLLVGHSLLLLELLATAETHLCLLDSDRLHLIMGRPPCVLAGTRLPMLPQQPGFTTISITDPSA